MMSSSPFLPHALFLDPLESASHFGHLIDETPCYHINLRPAFIAATQHLGPPFDCAASAMSLGSVLCHRSIVSKIPPAGSCAVENSAMLLRYPCEVECPAAIEVYELEFCVGYSRNTEKECFVLILYLDV